MKRCLRAGIATASLILPLLAMLPTSAGAVDARHPINRNYSASTKGQPGSAGGPGYVRVRGDLTWYGKRTFAISGKLNDVCPGDGHGAKFGLWTNYKHGPGTFHHLAKDLDGCDSPATTFSRSFHRDRRIKRVLLFLCESDPDDADTCVGFKIFGKDNPFT